MYFCARDIVFLWCFTLHHPGNLIISQIIQWKEMQTYRRLCPNKLIIYIIQLPFPPNPVSHVSFYGVRPILIYVDTPFAEAIRGFEPPGGKMTTAIAGVFIFVVGSMAGNKVYQ